MVLPTDALNEIFKSGRLAVDREVLAEATVGLADLPAFAAQEEPQCHGTRIRGPSKRTEQEDQVSGWVSG